MFLYLIDGFSKKTNQFYLFLNGSPNHNFISRPSNKSKTMKAQNISEIRAKLVSPYIMKKKLKEFMKNMI